MNMKLVIGLVSGLVVLGAGGVAWREWTHSPAWSLKQLVGAIEHHDRYEFEKYVDLDTLLQAAMTDATDGNPLAGALGGAVATSLKPQLIKMVEDGGAPTDARFEHGVRKLREPGFKPTIERADRNAYVHVPTSTNGGAPFTLKIHMTQVPDGYWRIDRIANLKGLMAAEAEEVRLRKAAIAKANDEKLATMRVVARLHTSVAKDHYGFDRKNRIQLRIENTGAERVASMTGHVRFPAQDYKEGIRGEVALDPGQSGTFAWELDVNRFIEPTERVYALGETESFDVDIDSLTYADGRRTRRGDDED